MGHPGFNRQWARIDEQRAAPARRRRGRAARRPVGRRRSGGGGPAARARRRGWPASSASARASSAAGPGSGAATSAPRSSTSSAAAERERRAGQRLPGHPADRRAQRRRLAAEPRLGLPDDPAAARRGPARDRRRARSQDPRLTAEGATYVAEHADELAPCGGRSTPERDERGRRASPTSSPRSARSWARCGRSSPPGSEPQQRAAIDVLVETRRKLYGILADGDDTEPRTTRTATSHERPDHPAQRRRARAAAADLGEHFAQGRLTADEHAERLEQVWAAKTRGELAPIFRDLPSPYAAVAVRPSVPHASATGMPASGRFAAGFRPRSWWSWPC